MIVLAFLSLAASSLLLPQEAPQVPGAYRGPVEERTLGADLEFRASGVLGLAQRRSGWEFWFEHERELLLRGEPDYPARAIGEDGRYGGEAWSVQRNELLLSSLPLLVEGLNAEDPALREASALALGRIGYPSSESLLAAAVEDPEPAVSQAACLGLGLLGTPGAEELLRDRFENPALTTPQRAIAAISLGLSGRTGAGSALKLHLASLNAGGAPADAVLTQAVVLAAAVHRSHDFVPLLLELDARTQKTEGAAAVKVRTGICQALGAIGDERAAPTLLGALSSADSAVARAAAQALGRLGVSAAVVPLADRAREAHDEDVRALCLLAIGRIGGNRATEELGRLKPNGGADQEVQAAWLLANGLARVKDSYERMRGTLLAGVRGAATVRAEEASAAPRGDESVRSAAAIGLGLFGNPQALEAIQSALTAVREGDPEFQGYLALALGMLRAPAAEARLLELANEAPSLDRQVRRGLAIGLGISGSERTSVALARLIVADPDAEVRWAGARALAYARSNDALRVLVEDLRSCLESREVPARAAHLALGLGFLGDAHQGATLDGLVAGMDFFQESRLVDTLRGY